MRPPLLVVVTGMPAAGKTTVAESLSRSLSLPLVAKDAVKERFYDTLGTGDLEWSERLGTASFALLFDFAHSARVRHRGDSGGERRQRDRVAVPRASGAPPGADSLPRAARRPRRPVCEPTTAPGSPRRREGQGASIALCETRTRPARSPWRPPADRHVAAGRPRRAGSTGSRPSVGHEGVRSGSSAGE